MYTGPYARFLKGGLHSKKSVLPILEMIIVTKNMCV